MSEQQEEPHTSPPTPAPQIDNETGDSVATRATKNPLMVQGLRIANRVHASAREWGRTDLGDRIANEAAQWNRGELVVVACGDIKRGKSSLLNALLDRPSLLPVDADVATSVQLVLRHGEQFDIIVTRIGDDGEPRQEHIDPDDLIDVASMTGDPAKREGVTSVEIVSPDELLARGIVLVDTPGVGGMTRGHRDLALAALHRADALLFTISASEPVARTELEFLAEATERTDRTLLIVTKSDTNTDAVNQAMLAEQRSKLKTFADNEQRRATAESRSEGARSDDARPDGDVAAAARLRRLSETPMILTSSYLANQAQRRREAGRVEQAADLWERSGIGALRSMLERSVDQRDDIRLANLIALLHVLLADVEREQQQRARALAGDASVPEEIAARQRALEEFGSKQARWRGALGNTIVRLQTSSSRLVTRELNRVKEQYWQLIATADDTDALLSALPADLQRSLLGAWNELVSNVNRDFQTTIAAVLAEFGADGMDAVLGEFAMPQSLQDLAGANNINTGEFNLLDDALPMAMQTFTFANIANAAAGVLGLATGGLGLVAYGIGVAIAYPIGNLRKRAREKQRAKADLQRFVADALFGAEGVAKEFTTELSLRILDLREAVEQYVEDRLAERRRQLDREQRELQNLMKAEAGRRQDLQRSIQATLSDIARYRAEIEPVQRAVDARLATTSVRNISS
ncbi:MAG: dynamin family protein [Acidimicrobiia bacterium]